MILKYDGQILKEGFIEAEYLLKGLKGFSLIIESIFYNRKVYLNVKSFEKGSFEIVFDFIEKHPVLFNSASLIISAVLSAVIIYAKKNKNTNIINIENISSKDKNLEHELINIFKDVKRVKKIRTGFHYLTAPLKEE